MQGWTKGNKGQGRTKEIEHAIPNCDCHVHCVAVLAMPLVLSW